MDRLLSMGEKNESFFLTLDLLCKYKLAWVVVSFISLHDESKWTSVITMIGAFFIAANAFLTTDEEEFV